MAENGRLVEILIISGPSSGGTWSAILGVKQLRSHWTSPRIHLANPDLARCRPKRSLQAFKGLKSLNFTLKTSCGVLEAQLYAPKLRPSRPAGT